MRKSSSAIAGHSMTRPGPYYRAVAPTPSAQYSITIRVEIEHRPGMLGKVATAIGDAGGTISTIDLLALESGHTVRDITVAVVSDGTAVLGLGDIGPEAAMPVMEGKAMLFKEFAGVDAFPICLDTKDADEIVETVRRIAPGFGGVNLEDISAPRCFEIEDRLKEDLDIPVFHDDQHGTAVVVLAALINACKLTGRDVAGLRVLVTGLGAARVPVSKILMQAGVSAIVGADSKGLVSTQRADYGDGSMNAIKRWYAEHTNPEELAGAPADALAGR